MNTTTRSVAAGIAVVLLGVIAVGAAGFGLLAPLIGLLGANVLGGSLLTAATVALAGLGVVSLAYASAAGFAAWAVSARRQVGVLVGIGVGLVAVLGATVATVSGGWHPALVAAYALGGGTIGALAVTAAAEAGRPSQG